jgi:Tfp pilus assembly protein PilF
LGFLTSKSKQIQEALENGFKYHERGDYYNAEKEYIKALKIDHKNSETHLKYGDLLRMTERPRAAEKEYRSAIEYQPNFAEAHSALAELLHRQGNIEEAEKEYRKAIDIKNHYVTPRINLGTLLMDQGRFTEARDMLNEALKVAKDPQLRAYIQQKLQG